MAKSSIIIAGVALAAGDFVNLYDAASGVTKVRKADASANRPANGYVIAMCPMGTPATVYFDGENTALTSLTVGSRYYLSATTPGAVTTTAPTTPSISQLLGVAISTTSLHFVGLTLSPSDFGGSDYDAIAAAVTAATANGLSELVIDRVYTLTGNKLTTIPSGISVRIAKGGGFTAEDFSTLLIKGGVIAAAQQIFFKELAVAGRVVGIRNVMPEWWGATRYNGGAGADASGAIQAAHNCMEAAASGSSDGDYCLRLTNDYVIAKQIELRPTGNFQLTVEGGGTLVNNARLFSSIGPGTATPAAIFIRGAAPTAVIGGITVPNPDAIVNFRLANFAVLPLPSAAPNEIGIQIGESGKVLTGLKRSVFENVYVENFPTCWDVTNCRLLEFSRVGGVTNLSNASALYIHTSDSANFTGDMEFISCEFVGPVKTTAVGMPGPATGSTVKIEAKNAVSGGGGQLKGITFTNVSVYHGLVGLEIAATVEDATIGDLFLDACRFDSPTDEYRNLVQITAVDKSSIRGVRESGGFFSGVTAGKHALEARRVFGGTTGIITGIDFGAGSRFYVCAGEVIFLDVDEAAITDAKFEQVGDPYATAQQVIYAPRGLITIVGNSVASDPLDSSRKTRYFTTFGANVDARSVYSANSVRAASITDGDVQDLRAAYFFRHGPKTTETDAGFRIGGYTTSARRLDVDPNGLLTARFGDNSLPPAVTLRNGGITGIGHGIGVNFEIAQSDISLVAAAIRAVSEDTFATAGNNSAGLSFHTIASNAFSERWRLTAPGHLAASVDNTYDIGTPAKRPRDVYAARTISSGFYTLAGLTSAVTAPVTGLRAFIIDATATTFASVAVGGGANKVPVYYDGSWKIG